MYKLFWFLFLLHGYRTNADFTFLLDEGYDITADNGILETRAAIYINHSSIMADADNKIAAAATKINALNYEAPKLLDKTDQISVLINAYDILANKIKSEYAKFKRIRNSLGSPPGIPADKTFVVNINEDTATQLLEDLATAATNIETELKAAGSWVTLKSQTARLSNFANAAENIITLLNEYLSIISVHTSILKLSTEGTLHENLKEHFFIDGTSHINFDTFVFLAAGKTDNDAVFIIEYELVKTVRQISKQIPVAYYGFSLQSDYFYDDMSHIYDKTPPHSGSTLQNLQNRTNCLNALNTKNISAVILYCEFIQNKKHFDILGNGILIHTITPTILNSLKRDLQYDAKDTIFPAYIEYNGNLSFTDPTVGPVIISKNSPFAVTSHSIPPEMLSLFRSFINTTLFPTQPQHNIFDYIINDFDEVFTNMVILLCIIMFFVIIKSLIDLYQRSTTDPNVFVLRILRQRFRRQ